jgi:hypothetical protein
MKKNTKFVWFSVLVGTAAVVVASLPGGGMLVKAAGTAHTCASIRFADNFTPDYVNKTSTAKYDGSISLETTTAFSDFATVSGVNVTAFTATKVYYNSYSEPKYTDKIAIKLGSSSKAGSLSLTFESPVCGMTVYAAGFQGYTGTPAVAAYDSPNITVGGVDVVLTTYLNSATSLGSVTSDSAEFKAYSVTFASTDKVTIAAKQNSKNRFFLADIAVQVVA